MNQVIETIKQIHSKDICMFKTGTFYHIYNKDAEIMSYIFDYKIKSFGTDEKECGFPMTALSKVMAKLENNKINYLTIDRRNNYDVDDKIDFKNLNNYEKYYEKASKELGRKEHIENLNKKLKGIINRSDFIQIIEEMEMIIDERGKI